jgi:DNA-directed RNA polymerase subunit K/omega
MRITTPSEVAAQAGNKYLGVLVAARFARYLNELPRERLVQQEEKLTTKALDALVKDELEFKLVRRRRSEARGVGWPPRRARRVGRDRVL